MAKKLRKKVSKKKPAKKAAKKSAKKPTKKSAKTSAKKPAKKPTKKKTASARKPIRKISKPKSAVSPVKSNGITPLLAELREVDERSNFDDITERPQLSVPEARVTAVPTLEPGVERPISSQLSERFAFAGSWTNAAAGQDFLSRLDMMKYLDNERVMENIKSQQERWEGSAPNRFSFDRLSLFAIDRDNPENHTFLVWKDDGTEPEVWFYAGQREERYEDLKSFLNWVIKS